LNYISSIRHLSAQQSFGDKYFCVVSSCLDSLCPVSLLFDCICEFSIKNMENLVFVPTLFQQPVISAPGGMSEFLLAAAVYAS